MVSQKSEKEYFRREVQETLKRFRMKPHRKDIVLEIDFITTQKNPPSIHTLAKNYLDLLHKPMHDIDDRRGILFRDDDQVKILIVGNRHDSSLESEPMVHIRCQSLGYFIEDLALSDRIIHNEFSNADDFYRSSPPLSPNYNDLDNSVDNLQDLEGCRDLYIKDGDLSLYESLRSIALWRIQEFYLENNTLDGWRLLFLLRALRKRKGSADEKIETVNDHWKELQNRYLVVANFLELGNAPSKRGEKAVFKTSLKNKLRQFRERHQRLFPLLVPITVSIIFVPPKGNIVDLDNLARYVVPFVNEIFEPPTEIKVFKNQDISSEEIDKIKNRPQNSIHGYQLVQLPREDSDPENGAIYFAISGSSPFNSNIWQRIRSYIEDWKSEIR